MSRGIAIVGPNGSGKTTLGKCLADALGCRHLDVEAYYFKPSSIPYASPRTREEVCALLLAEARRCERFVLSAVNCDFGEALNALYECVVSIHAPLELRLERVKQRSLDQFGSRVLAGGDMYEQEQAFFALVATRTMAKTDAWLQTLRCPVIDVDGARPIDENIAILLQRIGIGYESGSYWYGKNLK